MDGVVGLLTSKADVFMEVLGAKAALFANVTSLTDLAAAYKAIPFQWVLAGHCLFAATMAPDLKDKFLVHFWATFLVGFGGGLISSLLMMDPTKAPINILSNNAVGVTWFICWWLINYFPFNVVNKLHSIPPIKILTKLCVTFMRANLIINRVDLAVQLFPGVIAAPLILGTIAGSGGKLVTDGIRGGWGCLPGFAEASVPTFVWRSAFGSAAFYWAVCKYTTLLTSSEAAAIVITLLLAHSLLSDLLGPALTDFTYPLARVAHTVSLVPMPGVAATSGKSKASKPKQPQQAIAKAPAPAQQAATAAAAKAAPAAKPAKPAQPEVKQSKADALANGKPLKANGSAAPVPAPAKQTNGLANGTAKKESKKSK